MAAWGKEDSTDKIWLDCAAMAYSFACWDQTSQAIASFSLLSSAAAPHVPRLSPSLCACTCTPPPIWHLVARTVKAATKTCEARIGWLGGKKILVFLTAWLLGSVQAATGGIRCLDYC